MKKSLIFVGLLAIGFANAQDYDGKVGINTETPSATMNIKSKIGVNDTTKNFELENANGTKMVTVLDNGNVGIGTETPEVNLHIDGANGSNSELLLRRFISTRDGANLTFLKARGTKEAPIIPAIGDALVRFRSGGYTGIVGQHNQVTPSGFDAFASQIVTTVAGAPNTNGTLPTNMTLSVTNKAGGRNSLIKLQSDSGVGIGFGETEDIKGRLHINDWNDVTLTSTQNALLIGKENSANLVFDNNEIMARNNGTPTSLTLQAQGGDLLVNSENTDITKRFYFRSDTGNLGLGVRIPEEKLDISGNIKVSSLSGTGERIVVADKDGILKIGTSISSNNGVHNESTMKCNSTNAGKINYTTREINGEQKGVFGFCMQKGLEYVWAYMVGGANIFGTSSNEAAFGDGL